MIKNPRNTDHKFKTQEQLESYLVRRHQANNLIVSNTIELENLSFEFNTVIPFKIDISGQIRQILANKLPGVKYIFSNCVFNSQVTIKGSQIEIVFKDNCWFDDKLRVQSRKKNLTFKNCVIKDLDVSESTFGEKEGDLGKLRIKSCEVYKTNFKNATFFALVDFYFTNFNENVIYYKTDFFNIVVLSATTFKKNLLFTYTLLNDKVIMRSTIFQKGFDFSLAIIKGHLAIFNIKHSFDKYVSVDGLKDEKEYEKEVSYNGNIPTQNKLETYRLLKVEFEKQKNLSEHLHFKLYEKRAYHKILKNNDFSWINTFDQITLWLNKISNNHATSYVRAFFFVVIVGWIFFYLSIISTNSFEFSLNINEWEFSKGLEYFVQFILPTHKFNYMGENVLLTECFFLFDFLGRIFVGYGIYQFIQAFRKFK
jgi:hypothetical protein